MKPQPNDRCKCGHTFEFHAPDLTVDKDRCWYGAVWGDSCACISFEPKEEK